MSHGTDVDVTDAMDRAVHCLERAHDVLFITGAGISADSGLPTYRGIGGLYNDLATDEGVPIEVALSGEMMARDPALTWKYIHQIVDVKLTMGAADACDAVWKRLERLA